MLASNRACRAASSPSMEPRGQPSCQRHPPRYAWWWLIQRRHTPHHRPVVYLICIKSLVTIFSTRSCCELQSRKRAISRGVLSENSMEEYEVNMATLSGLTIVVHRVGICHNLQEHLSLPVLSSFTHAMVSDTASAMSTDCW